jgi:putative phosphoribosyl transferase
MRRARRWLARLSPAHLRDGPDMVFPDRRQAGRRLAAALMRLKALDPIVLALPRGGVPVAFEVAQALDAPLDVVLVRKIGAPGHPELGLGAVVEGAAVVLNDEIVRLVAPNPAYLQQETARQLEEIERRRELYRGGRAPVAAHGRLVIVIDDGIATGGTVRAALRALAQAKPARLVLAVPVAPKDAIATLAAEADEVVCLASPEPFLAVGAHYQDFRQTSDEEVVELLRSAAGDHRP